MAISVQEKIKHIVVLMLENRSFDHLFGFRQGVEGLSGNESNLLAPSKPQSLDNPPFTVGTGAPFAIATGQGPGHSLKQTNVQLFGNSDATGPGTNKGFVASYNTELTYADHVKSPTNGDLAVVMQSFSAAQLPAINALADNFAICDHWYAEVPGPTQPNRLFLHAATSEGHALNQWSMNFSSKTIYEQIQEKPGLTWATYEHDSNEVREFNGVKDKTACFKQFSSFATDCASGDLANYSFIAPRMLADKDGQMVNSQHAPHDVRWGEILIADVYEAMRKSPIWESCALVIVYDEHGGFYDHVTPPAAANPDGKNSPTPTDPSYATPFKFDRLGLRVGAVVVSPWIPPHTLVDKPLQHTSIMKTAREIFGIVKADGTDDFLTMRDKDAASFADIFSLPEARKDAPIEVPRPELPSVPAITDSSHPANQPLDALQHGIVLGTHHRTRDKNPSESAENLPVTQGEASAWIKARH
jgi:phospholipase C